MTLIKFEPLKEFESFQNQIKKYFDDFPSFGMNFENSFSPRIDISEKNDKILVEAEIPGVKKEDLKITLQDNILTIKGEKKKEEESKDNNYYRCERSYGSFSRSFTLPAEVNTEKVDAKFSDGMLKIELKKIEPKKAQEKLIELK
ncbi:MAG: Hsp20/alpha crystallin family protein [Melioribacteraceae bacterium]|nr:MAG: Hsp20/alpha crystallin family protein [Melioribacteraceae bacterium]